MEWSLPILSECEKLVISQDTQYSTGYTLQFKQNRQHSYYDYSAKSYPIFKILSPIYLIQQICSIVITKQTAEHI